METSKPWPPSQLAEELDKMKGMKFPNKTGFEIMTKYNNHHKPVKEMVITNQEIKKLIKR